MSTAVAPTTDLRELSFHFASLRQAYAHHHVHPAEVIEEVYRRISADNDPHIWLSLFPKSAVLAQVEDLLLRQSLGEVLPLFGLPFGVKDNIDVANLSTTSACTAFRRNPTESADVVTALQKAGALLIGKQNMDQFATGLVGIRSLTGHCHNAFSTEHIPGGSSSGSAVAVAKGHVAFSIGSDTGGSGRVPAACNNVVGLKPTPGTISTRGFVYCNRSFDVAPVFALTVDDAYDVLSTLEHPHLAETTSRHSSKLSNGVFTYALPHAHQLTFFGDTAAETAFEQALSVLAGLKGQAQHIDFTPFERASQLLFNSALLTERLVDHDTVLHAHPESVHAAVAQTLHQARHYTAKDLLRAQYEQTELQQQVHALLRNVDVLVLPTCATLPRIAEVEAEPLLSNSRMGHYTYFANPLKLAVVSVPAGLRPDGLPFGISFIGLPHREKQLQHLAARFHQTASTCLGTSRTLTSSAYATNQSTRAAA